MQLILTIKDTKKKKTTTVKNRKPGSWTQQREMKWLSGEEDV